MIRGALVFGAGLAIGYAKAVSETEAVNKTVHDVVEKVKTAWEEAETGETSSIQNVDDARRQLGIEFLMKRLEDALPYAEVSDETPIIRGAAGEAVLTMGDLRAPFSVPSTPINTPEGETPQ